MEFYYIPLNYKSGVYRLSELPSENKDSFDLMYDEKYEILECSEDNRLLGISQQQIYETLQATYSGDGRLNKITVEDKKHMEQLVYIFFSDRHTAEKMVQEWSLKISDNLSQQILLIKEPLSRLFLGYYNDGQCVDFHVVPVTEEQRRITESVPQIYPGIHAGNFEQYAVRADDACKYLASIFSCTGEWRYELFDFAKETIIKRLQETVLDKIHKAEDFEFIADEYD